MNPTLAASLSALLLSSCATLNLTAPSDDGSTSSYIESSTGDAAIDAGAAVDDPLDAIVPELETISVGLAGEDPADIGRYLLARGAGAPRLSPNGNHVAYRSNLTGVPQIWIADVESGQSRQLTYGNGVTFFRWAPDSTALVYGADNDGNEQEAYYRIALDGSEEALLLPAVTGGFRAFGDISADGKTAVFASTERNGLDFDIYLADLDTAETMRVFDGTYGYQARALSPDGTKLVMSETVGEDSDNLYLLDLESGEVETLSAPSPRANHTDGGVVWLPDSSGFYVSTNLDGEFAQLNLYNVEAGQRFPVDPALTTGEGEPIGDHVDVNLCGEDGRYLAFAVNLDGFFDLKVIDRTNGASLPMPRLPEGVYNLSCHSGSSRLAVGINGWRTPGDVYVIDLETKDVFQAYASDYAGLNPNRLVRPESVRITARDGVDLQGLLYLPDDASRTADDLPPIIFQVHGGPTAQSMANFDPIVQYHVDRGFAVFEPNVRGSTGFGRTYVTLDDREKRRDSVRDLVDLLEGLRADGRVDVDRAAVTGGSYGGYMVNPV